MHSVCTCSTPLILLRMGLFPCSPVRPTLAVDLNMLEYLTELFVRSPPNITAWCDTLEAFLGNRQYKIETRVSYIIYVSLSVCLSRVAPSGWFTSAIC